VQAPQHDSAALEGTTRCGEFVAAPDLETRLGMWCSAESVHSGCCFFVLVDEFVFCVRFCVF